MSMLTCDTRSVTSSDTRRPLAYSVSSIVRSRSPSGDAIRGAASNASTSASVRLFGNVRGSLGASILSVGSTSIRFCRSAWR